MMVDGAATPPLVYFRDERDTLSLFRSQFNSAGKRGEPVHTHTHTQKVDNITDTLCVDGVAARVS